jgi:mRNA-degrading endonuclease RelE of RelBE toxin-antitoxin system
MIFIWQSLFIFLLSRMFLSLLEQTILTMKNPTQALKNPIFHWFPKHLQHITENIVIQKRNVSFLAINALFRQKHTHIVNVSTKENGHFVVEDFVKVQKNDLLRTHAENLKAIFYLDDHNNIIVITAYSENDEDYRKY